MGRAMTKMTKMKRRVSRGETHSIAFGNLVGRPLHSCIPPVDLWMRLLPRDRVIFRTFGRVASNDGVEDGDVVVDLAKLQQHRLKG